MQQLNSWQLNKLVHSPDPDMSLRQARRLLKAIYDESQPRRRRTLPNSFATLSGRAQPREGFLSVELLRAIYIRSELVRACVDTLIEFFSAVNWTIRPIDEDRTGWLKERRPDEYKDQQQRIAWLKTFFRRPNTYEDLDTFHRRLLRDLLIFDAAGYEIITADYPDGGRLPIEIGGVAGDTIEIETDDHGIPVTYWQSYNVLHNQPYQPEDLAYLMLNPCSWQAYGLSPIETAYITIATDLSAGKYNADVFGKNNIPPALLAVLGVSQAEFTKIMSQLRSTSADNPHNIHAVRANRAPDGSAQKVFEMIPMSQVSNRDMQYRELLQLCINRVCMMYRVTPSQIGFTEQIAGGIGSGIAETQENLSQNKGVAPLLRKVSQTHTFNVIQSICGWDDVEFAFVQSNTPQEQLDYQRSLQELQSGVITQNEFRQRWGGRKPVDWGDQPLNAPQGYQPPGAQPAVGDQPAMPQLPQAMQKSTKRIIFNY
ncbi:phage portal protein [Leptolyngbya sp. FACHB-36]|uniref:phage portal protein n=1 Tax=Leptolyngbya sp. FACHB-36 TaxID=2692808 RepID=UPI00168005A8|nr:phage portal protein [Leptolyngbya sp. FACHB-36]MBD2019306.1 phage portal protein [Leptolyngbya sp. FACHB-36]